MGISTVQKLLILSLALSLLFLGCFPTSFSAFVCHGRLGCGNGRRLPYYPTPPTANKGVRQDQPRTPPVREQTCPPSPSTII